MRVSRRCVLTNTVQLVETPLETANRMSSSLLMIAQALTKNHNTKRINGSQHSYIKEDIAKVVGIEAKATKGYNNYSLWRPCSNRNIVSSLESYYTMRQMGDPRVSNYGHETEDTTVPPYNSKDRKEVDILIGMDHYWDSSLTQHFGPVLSGSQSSSIPTVVSNSNSTSQRPTLNITAEQTV
ncbi:hypothetical protein OSTOST_12779 [Ostertagia ostertagi]